MRFVDLDGCGSHDHDGRALVFFRSGAVRPQRAVFLQNGFPAGGYYFSTHDYSQGNGGRSERTRLVRETCWWSVTISMAEYRPFGTGDCFSVSASLLARALITLRYLRPAICSL